ncbi:MAG: lipopolysaccharide heptosyltransferase II, partial [Armatimonadota bacterium]
MSVQAKSVLVIGPSWVGDMVMAQSLFLRLRERAPDRAIDVLAPGWSLPLIARMPQVRRGIEMPLGHGQLGLGARRRLGHALRANGYAQAIVLPGSWKSALVPWFARIPRRTGYAGELRYGLLNDVRRLDEYVLRSTVQRFVALAEERNGDSPHSGTVPISSIPTPRLDADPANAATLVARLGLQAGRAVGLMPGAEYGPAKRWPAEYFGALAKSLGEAGVQSWIFGSAKEHELGEQIRQLGGAHAVNLCGKTALTDVVDLAAQWRSVVTNDSGLMHVAAATGVPVVALFGSSSPEFTPPLTDRARVHYLHLEC